MLGEIISAGASILGGILGQRNQNKQAELNRQMQLDYAQNAIQWKTEDAKKAGIHPIYALGAPTMSYSPVSLGDSLTPAISNAGQNLGRAINSTSSQETRATAYTQALQALQLERGSLENETLRSNLARMRQTPNPAPATPTQAWGGIPGQGDDPANTISTSQIKEKMERDNWNPVHPSGEAFAIPDTGYLRTPDGWIPAPSKEAKNRIEDIEPHEWAHYFRNNIGPGLTTAKMNPPFAAPAGTAWTYDPWNGYQLYDYKNGRYLNSSQAEGRR